MIEGLLALSRIARGTTLRAEALDISAPARSVLVQLREAHPTRNVDCEIAADVRASGDRRLLHTALDNLLGNAWKFTGKVSEARIAAPRSATARPCTSYATTARALTCAMRKNFSACFSGCTAAKRSRAPAWDLPPCSASLPVRRTDLGGVGAGARRHVFLYLAPPPAP